MCPDGTSSKFWFRNICEKIKSDLQNRSKREIAMLHFFWDTLYLSWGRSFAFKCNLIICCALLAAHCRIFFNGIHSGVPVQVLVLITWAPSRRKLATQFGTASNPIWANMGGRDTINFVTTFIGKYAFWPLSDNTELSMFLSVAICLYLFYLFLSLLSLFLSVLSVAICLYLFYLFFYLCFYLFYRFLSVSICFYLFWSVSICFCLFYLFLSVFFCFICFYLFSYFYISLNCFQRPCWFGFIRAERWQIKRYTNTPLWNTINNDKHVGVPASTLILTWKDRQTCSYKYWDGIMSIKG